MATATTSQQMIPRKGSQSTSLFRYPTTPTLDWKLFDGASKVVRTATSSRELAAGLWQLQLSGGRRRTANRRRGCDHDVRLTTNIGIVTAPSNALITTTEHGGNYYYNNNDGVLLPPHVSSHLSHRVLPNVYCIYGTTQKIMDQRHCAILSLQSELFQADQLRIHELQQEWRNKIGVVVGGLMDELRRERKSRKQMELVNCKLVNELVNVKWLAKRLGKDLEEEMRARELVELVCDELATKVAEQKRQVEEMKKEAMELEAQVGEDRMMMHMAELWREERVQMKMNDARLALETKYHQVLEMILQLEDFRNNVEEETSDLYTVIQEADHQGNVKVIKRCNINRDQIGSNVGSSVSSPNGSEGSIVARNKAHIRTDGFRRRQRKFEYCVGEWNLAKLLNPHITLEVKGSIEWPQGSGKYKSSSKGKISQARKLTRRRAKVIHVVKQRISAKTALP